MACVRPPGTYLVCSERPDGGARVAPKPAHWIELDRVNHGLPARALAGHSLVDVEPHYLAEDDCGGVLSLHPPPSSEAACLQAEATHVVLQGLALCTCL